MRKKPQYNIILYLIIAFLNFILAGIHLYKNNILLSILWFISATIWGLNAIFYIYINNNEGD